MFKWVSLFTGDESIPEPKQTRKKHNNGKFAFVLYCIV